MSWEDISKHDVGLQKKKKKNLPERIKCIIPNSNSA